MSNSFRWFKPAGYKTIVLHCTFCVRVEYLNLALYVTTKIKMVQRLHYKGPFNRVKSFSEV